MYFHALFTLILTFFSHQLLAFNEEKVAASLGLEIVSEGHPYNFMGINAIYVNDSMERQMLVVSNVPGELKELRIYEHKGFLIVELPKTADSYVSMALVGITKEEILNSIKTTSVWHKILNELNPIPRAYANDCGIQGNPSLNGIEGLQNYYGSSLAKGALSCISSFLQGVWDSTGGAVAGAAEGIKNLVSDPRAFWDKKVTELKNLGNFITHFDSKIKEMATGIAQLPSETKTMLICGFVGGLGADVALAILAGGAGLAKVFLRLEQYVSKVARLNKVFELMQKVGKLQSLPSTFFEKLATNRLPVNMIDNLDSFAHYGLVDVVQGAMQCVL